MEVWSFIGWLLTVQLGIDPRIQPSWDAGRWSTLSPKRAEESEPVSFQLSAVPPLGENSGEWAKEKPLRCFSEGAELVLSIVRPQSLKFPSLCWEPSEAHLKSEGISCCASLAELPGISRSEINNVCINNFQVPVTKGNLQKRECLCAYAIRVLKVHHGRTKTCGKSNNLKTHTLNYKPQAEVENWGWHRILNLNACFQWCTSSTKAT